MAEAGAGEPFLFDGGRKSLAVEDGAGAQRDLAGREQRECDQGGDEEVAGDSDHAADGPFPWILVLVPAVGAHPAPGPGAAGPGNASLPTSRVRLAGRQPVHPILARAETGF
jgi:hypothetical protein